MKSPLLALVLLLSLALPIFAADPEPPVPDENYEFLENVPYRNADSPGWDDYMEERCVLDIYHPKKIKDFATVVWIHGGGLKAGKKKIPLELRERGVAIVAINYRLSPKVKCPTYIEDAAAAVAWTFENIESYGGDKSLIFLAGHSAGGYLTSMVGLDKSYLAAHDIDANDLAAIFPISGQTITHSTIREERDLPRTVTIVDEFAPSYHVRPDASPMMLTTGGRREDMPARWEENVYLDRMMEVAKHKETTLYEIQGFNHGTMVPPAHELMLGYIHDLLKARKPLDDE